MQKNLLGKLPKWKPNRKQKKDEQNRSSQLFLQYYDVISEIFSDNIEISEAVAVKLTEMRLLDPTERDQINAITCESIKIRAMMRSVDAVLKKAVRPDIQLRKLMGVLASYKCFSCVIHKLQTNKGLSIRL